MTKDNKYWAADSQDQIGDSIMKKVEDYQNFLLTSGRLELYRRAYNYYYKSVIKGAKTNRSGEQGEFTTINVNHYRNLLLHLKTMTTQQRPTFEPRATNTDYKSQAQTILASGLLEYYLREKKVERYIKNAVEQGLLFGEGFIRCEWDTSAGEIYGINPETGAEITQGDLSYTNFTPLDVARDFTKNNSDKHDWYILTSGENRYSLMAKYPDLSDKIERVASISDFKDYNRIKAGIYEDSDDVLVYSLYHRPCPALPQGRVTTILDSDIILLDGPLPYRNLPVYRLAPEEQIDSIFGYTVGFDLIAVQEAVDSLYSTVLTNQSTFGVQNIAIPKGHDLSVTSISGGLNLIEYDTKLGKPESLNLTQTPPEIFNFISQLERLQETLSGVNSVARGNPEASLKSGSALALVQSQAIQFSMNLQQSYAHLLEDVGTATINILRDFASVPRVAVIAGKSNRSLMKQFTGDDLNLINRVTVDMGNPLSRSTSGKVQLAENLLANGLVKTPDEYIQVLSTGRLEPVIEGTQAELLNIKAENEEMTEGKVVPVMVTDDHKTHIQEHKAILASPEARRNPELIKIVTDHLREHISILSNPENTQLLIMLGQEPLQSTAPAPALPESLPQSAPSSAELLDTVNPVTGKAAEVRMPNQPRNPLTGEHV